MNSDLLKGLNEHLKLEFRASHEYLAMSIWLAEHDLPGFAKWMRQQSTDELSEQQKTEVFNTLEWIEAVANNSADERMVCERRPVLGSTRKERVCKTAAQWREEREAARSTMDSRSICRDCGGIN